MFYDKGADKKYNKGQNGIEANYTFWGRSRC